MLTSYICIGPLPASSVQLRRPFDASWGRLGLGNPAAGALCKPPKEEVVEMNRPRGVPSEHQRNKISLRQKPNVTMGLSSHSRQNSGTNQALGFLDHFLGGRKQWKSTGVRPERHSFSL